MRRLALLLVVACGPTAVDEPDAAVVDAAPPADAPPPDAPVNVPCTMMLSGAVTGTFACTASAVKRDADSFTLVGAIGTGSGEVQSLLFAARVPGEPAVRDYAVGDLESIDVAIQTSSNGYVASGTTGTVGTLRLTALVPQTVPMGKAWAPHGSFTATLVATGAPGMVTMAVTF